MPLHGGHRHPVRLIDLETAMPDPMQLAREQEKRELAAERARQRRPGSYDTGSELPGTPDDPDDLYGP